MSSTANPTRQKATEHKDPLVAAAQQKVNEAKQKLNDLQAAATAAREEAERNEAQLTLLRQAAALQEAEVTQRNEELTTTHDEAQQQLDRIKAVLDIKDDQPESATPEVPVAKTEPKVIDHPVADPPAVTSHEPESTSQVSPDPVAATQATPRKTFKQHLQGLWSRMI